MRKGLLGLAALLTVTGCTAETRVKATPLRDQSASQIEADRARCEEWAKRTASVTVGYAACMISAEVLMPRTAASRFGWITSRWISISAGVYGKRWAVRSWSMAVL